MLNPKICWPKNTTFNTKLRLVLNTLNFPKFYEMCFNVATLCASIPLALGWPDYGLYGPKMTIMTCCQKHQWQIQELTWGGGRKSSESVVG